MNVVARPDGLQAAAGAKHERGPGLRSTTTHVSGSKHGRQVTTNVEHIRPLRDLTRRYFSGKFNMLNELRSSRTSFGGVPRFGSVAMTTDDSIGILIDLREADPTSDAADLLEKAAFFRREIGEIVADATMARDTNVAPNEKSALGALVPIVTGWVTGRNLVTVLETLRRRFTGMVEIEITEGKKKVSFKASPADLDQASKVAEGLIRSLAQA